MINHELGSHSVVTEPDHSATTDCGKSGIFQALHFKHNSNIGGQIESLAGWQSEQLVIVKHTVEVLNPFRINIPIEDDPVSFRFLTTEIVDYLSQSCCEKSICPLTSGTVKTAVQCF